MSSENCYWKKIRAQRNPAEKPSKLRLNVIGRRARRDLDKNSFESKTKMRTYYWRYLDPMK
jgi:hypothetical protein